MKRLILIFCCAIGGMSLIILLHLFSFEVNKFGNGFIRLFPPHSLNHPKTLPLDNAKYYIAGLTRSHIYLGTPVKPSVLVADYSLNDTNNLAINTSGYTWPWGRSITFVDSEYIYLFDGNAPFIRQAKLPDLHLHSLNIPDKLFFSSCFPISQTSFIVRAYDTTLKQNILIKRTSYSPNERNPKFILPKQIDGYFCTDGVLDFNRDSKEIVYTFYYRNQFLCLDTNLKLIHNYKTIDTVNLAKLKIAKLLSKNGVKATLAAPPLVVNKRCCIDNGLLFINSGLKANNESTNTFANSSVIDIYTLKNGRYKYSFYLPVFGGERLTDFKIIKKKIVVLYPHSLVVYDLSI